MKLSEIKQTEHDNEDVFESQEPDAYGTRRPRLTLRALHRLRLINDLKKQEAEQHQKFVARMYGGNFEESDEKEETNEKDAKNPPKIVKPPKPFKPLKPSSSYLDKHTRS